MTHEEVRVWAFSQVSHEVVSVAGVACAIRLAEPLAEWVILGNVPEADAERASQRRNKQAAAPVPAPQAHTPRAICGWNFSNSCDVFATIELGSGEVDEIKIRVSIVKANGLLIGHAPSLPELLIIEFSRQEIERSLLESVKVLLQDQGKSVVSVRIADWFEAAA